MMGLDRVPQGKLSSRGVRSIARLLKSSLGCVLRTCPFGATAKKPIGMFNHQFKKLIDTEPTQIFIP